MSSTAAPEPRRSSRRRAAHPGPSPTIRGLPITAFRRPWVQHYIDIGHCRLKKCTKRIAEASDADIARLSVSFLAMAIKASTAYGPRAKQEEALLNYTRAVMARGISPNDHDERLGSAVSMSAYFGYPQLLKLLLEAGCPITSVHEGTPHALRAAVKNTQHECIRVLLQVRPDQVRELLHEESLARWPARVPTTLREAMKHGDVTAIELLRQQKAKVLIQYQHNNQNKWTTVLKKLYPSSVNVVHWSPELHWSFPGVDRRMLNWLWYALERQREYNSDSANTATVTLPSAVWLKVFGFLGRGSWSLSALGDQNGYELMPPSMTKNY